MDTIYWIIFIGIVGYYINKKFFGLGGERNFNKLAKDLSEEIDKELKKQERSNNKGIYDKFIKELQSRLTRLVKTHDDYLHLRERYKHSSFNKIRSIDNDWLTYTNAHKKLIECDMDFAMLDDNKLLQKAGENRYKADIVIAETEKRFKKLLDKSS